MAQTTATLNVDETVLDDAMKRYRDLGFEEVGDLISAALRDYLKRSDLERKHEAMRRAAASPRYQAVLRAISEDFAAADAELLPDEY